VVSKLFLFVFVSLWSFSLNALQDDRKAPIKVVSDRAEQNEKKGTATYEGSVVVRQGSIVINADRVIIVTDTEDGDRIVCTGNPAHYQQVINTEDGLVIASANTIQYFLKNERIGLIQDASLEQNGTTITGDKIDYDLKAEIVKASSQSDTKQRIEMVIPPTK
jgi:lipopolysaccharide export system protein LptA|tara:strand:+ start:282 stop:770 length:489 start_codon:yes stop_codon:yes gene_type:complete